MTTGVELRIENRQVTCDWGTFGDETPRAKWDWETDTTTVENLAPLVFVAKPFADDPNYTGGRDFAALTHFYTDSGRRFMRIIAANGDWTWELFDAHWDDGTECDCYVGRCQSGLT